MSQVGGSVAQACLTRMALGLNVLFDPSESYDMLHFLSGLVRPSFGTLVVPGTQEVTKLMLNLVWTPEQQKSRT